MSQPKLFVPESDSAAPHEEPYATCPACGYRGSVQDFDVMGADDDHLFCNQCGEHFDPINLEWVIE